MIHSCVSFKQCQKIIYKIQILTHKQNTYWCCKRKKIKKGCLSTFVHIITFLNKYCPNNNMNFSIYSNFELLWRQWAFIAIVINLDCLWSSWSHVKFLRITIQMQNFGNNYTCENFQKNRENACPIFLGVCGSMNKPISEVRFSFLFSLFLSMKNYLNIGSFYVIIKSSSNRSEITNQQFCNCVACNLLFCSYFFFKHF